MLRKNKSLDEDFGIHKYQTLVGRNTRMEGRITFSDGVRIDGRVTGDIEAERDATGAVAIGPEAEVRGNITAHRILVAGTVIGNIRASESAHLLPTARITGDVAYAKLTVSAGAKVNGTLSDLSHASATAERPANLIRLADKTQDNGLQADRG